MMRQLYDAPFAFPEPVVESLSVLVPGASEARIATQERRLGIRLPPSYRQFLGFSNGAYAGTGGLQRREAPSHRDTTRTVRTLGLLAVEDIDYSIRWCSEYPVDGMLIAASSALPYGHSTLFTTRPRPDRDEASYLGAHLTGTHSDFRTGHLCYSLTIGIDDAGVLILNPMSPDGDGEWETLYISYDGEGPRYPSFLACLEGQTEQQESGTDRNPRRTVDQLWVDASSSDSWVKLRALNELIAHREDPHRIQEMLEQKIINDDDLNAHPRRYALQLLRSLDVQDDGNRFAEWVTRVLTDAQFDDIEVLALVAELDDGRTPTVAEVARHRRRADLAELQALPTSALVALYEQSPDPIHAEFLAQHGHPLVVAEAEAELAELIRSEDYALPPPPFPDEPDPRVRSTPEQLIEAADSLAQRGIWLSNPRFVGRALARAGYRDRAVGYLETKRTGEDAFNLLYPIAELDTPRSWAILDEAAQDDRHGLNPFNTIGLLAATRTRSPQLPHRCRELITNDRPTKHVALLALELQKTDQAADALLDLWHNGSYEALRALARRQDDRITTDAIHLVNSPDPDLQTIGAETLRDLRNPDTVSTLIEAITRSTTDNVTLIESHALVAMQATETAPLLNHLARSATNPAIGQLLNRWSHQLATVHHNN